MALRLSLANSPGVFQGDSPNWSEKGNSVANSSKEISGVLKVDEADFFLLGVFGNKRFPFDPVLKENLGFFLLSRVLGDCLIAGVTVVCGMLGIVAFLFILFWNFFSHVRRARRVGKQATIKFDQWFIYKLISYVQTSVKS